MRSATVSRLPLWLAAAAICFLITMLPRQAFAGAPADDVAFSRSGARAPVSERVLATVRGGFETSDASLQLSVGLQRQVLIDGQAVAVSNLQFCGPSCATGDGTLALVQRGAGNTVALVGGGQGLATGSQGLVVQNTLDQTRLQALTTLDIKTNSLQLFQGAAMQAALTGSLAASTRR